MPKFYKRKGKSEGERSDWFVRVKNYSSTSPPSYTFQLKQPAINLLRGMGLSDGDVFDKAQFQTLQDLDLTYTLNGDLSHPPISGTLPENVADDIPPEQRVEFVIELLNEVPIRDIDSNGFYNLLLSIDEGPEELKTQLIEFLLDSTPIDTETLDALSGEPEIGSDLVAALVCYAFEEFVETLDNEIEGHVTPIAQKDCWIYLQGNDAPWDLSYGLCDYYFKMPSSFLERAVSRDPPRIFVRDIIGQMHTNQFVRDLHAHLKDASLAVPERAKGTVLIVPDTSVDKFDETNCLNLYSARQQGFPQPPRKLPK